MFEHVRYVYKVACKKLQSCLQTSGNVTGENEWQQIQKRILESAFGQSFVENRRAFCY